MCEIGKKNRKLSVDMNVLDIIKQSEPSLQRANKGGGVSVIVNVSYNKLKENSLSTPKDTQQYTQ